MKHVERLTGGVSTAGRIFVWRDAHGTEVDFAIERNGRVRLVEAKWTEGALSPRALAPIAKVDAVLGKLAEKEHWVACRTRHSHTLPEAPRVRLVDAVTFDGWFADEAPVRRRSRTARVRLYSR